jgi:hypothetical protein
VRKQYLLPLPQASVTTLLAVHLNNKASSSTYKQQSSRLEKAFSPETSVAAYTMPQLRRHKLNNPDMLKRRMVKTGMSTNHVLSISVIEI